MKFIPSVCKYLLAAAVIISCAGVLPAAVMARDDDPEAQADIAAGRYYALVIGNNAYQHIQRLKTAEDDAKEVENILRGQYAFQTKLLLNATRQQIISAINFYRRELTPDANLLIYYAGHGINDKEIDKAYWLPVDARLDDNSNWISADDITSNIKGIPAKHVLIVSDSCYSGTLTRGLEASLPAPSERQRYLQKMSLGKSRTLMASGGNEPVADGGGGNHSIFANALLRGLAQMDKSHFTAGELFRDFVEESVAGRANQTPEYNPLRNSGHESGDFIFVRTTTARQTSEPTPTATTPSSASTSPARAATFDPAAMELSFWESIKNSSDPQDFKAYLNKYPDGVFADLARRRADPKAKAPTGTAPAGNAPAGNAAASNPPDRGARQSDAKLAAPALFRGVRDYFFSIPEQYLDVPISARAALLRRDSAVVDIQNGYISFQNGATDYYVLAVFKRSAGNYLAALNRTDTARATAKLTLLKYEGGQWNDVTAVMLPVPYDPALNYELPRIGKNISVTNRAGVKVYDLVWTAGKFVLNRAR